MLQSMGPRIVHRRRGARDPANAACRSGSDPRKLQRVDPRPPRRPARRAHRASDPIDAESPLRPGRVRTAARARGTPAGYNARAGSGKARTKEHSSLQHCCRSREEAQGRPKYCLSYCLSSFFGDSNDPPRQAVRRHRSPFAVRIWSSAMRDVFVRRSARMVTRAADRTRPDMSGACADAAFGGTP